MPKVFTSQAQKSGEIAEYVAERYFVTRGFSILDRNYTKKWGEIDIVALKDKRVHFIEVKSKAVADIRNLPKRDSYRPEDQMHAWKIKRLSRTIETYIAETGIEGDWQVNLALVYINLET